MRRPKDIIGKIKNKKMKKQENAIIGIYKITSPSGKIYIGQSVDILLRWERDYKKARCKSQTKLYNSLIKYGWDSHEKEIIEECIESQLIERETYYKMIYKVLEIPSLCCRIDGKGGRDSEETKRKKSESQKGNKYALGAIHSIESRLITSNKLTGIKKSSDSIIKMSKPRIKLDKFKTSNKEKKKKIVIQYSLNMEFIKEWPSVKEAESTFNSKNKSNISACCLGKQKTAWGFKWKYK